jgi:hypothetical protein
MRVKGVAARHGRFAREGVADSPGSTAIMRKIVWARGPKHGRSLATARRGAMSNIGKAALRI